MKTEGVLLTSILPEENARMTNGDKQNAAPTLRWVMAVSAIIFKVLFLFSLADDFLPFMRGRMIGYSILVTALGGCCWVWGWLTRDRDDRYEVKACREKNQ